MDANAPNTQASMVSIVTNIKYTAASALLLSMWDNIVTLDQEAAYIWSSPLALPQIVYLLTRYGNIATLLYANFLLSGLRGGTPNTVTQCKVFPLTFGTVLMVYTFLYNVYIALRLYVLWDHRRRIKAILCGALAVSYIPMFVLGELGFLALYRNTGSLSVPGTLSQISTCFINKQSNLVKAAFGCMASFDFFVIILTAYNSLDRPRRPQHSLIKEMRRDGAIWFVVLFLMRFLNFVFFLTLSLDHNLMAFILIWALISVAVSRMILHIETLKRPLVDVTSRNAPTITRMPAQEMIVLVRADRITDTCSSNTGH